MHKFLIVNTTIVNSCIYFVDPLNMTIIDSIFINAIPDIGSLTQNDLYEVV